MRSGTIYFFAKDAIGLLQLDDALARAWRPAPPGVQLSGGDGPFGRDTSCREGERIAKSKTKLRLQSCAKECIV